MAVPALPGGAGPLDFSGGAGGNAGPSTAKNGDAMFDNGGWTVTFGDNSPATAAGGGLATYLPWAVAAVGVLIAWRMFKR